MAPRAGLVARWRNWLVEKPVQANIVQAGGLMLGGDYIAQRIEHRGRCRDESSLTPFSFDVPRAGVLCAFVPFSTVFYLELWKLLDRKWPLQIARQSAAKAMTSSVFGGSLMTASFFAFVAVGQAAIHRSMSDPLVHSTEVGTRDSRTKAIPLHRVGIQAVQEKWGPAMQIGGGFWFVCNYCNFQFAPPSMRILIMSGQSLFWNTLLSLMQA